MWLFLCNGENFLRFLHYLAVVGACSTKIGISIQFQSKQVSSIGGSVIQWFCISYMLMWVCSATPSTLDPQVIYIETLYSWLN